MTAVAVSGSLLAASPTVSEFPASLGHWNGRPIWVDAESAVDRSGRLNAVILGEQSARISTELARRSSRDECRVFKSWSSDHFKSTATLEQLVANSEMIVAGTVIARRQGIFYDTPGTLLRLDAEVLKGQATQSTYLFYPYARIQTAEGMLCCRSFNGDESAPGVGDRFLAFAILPPYVADGVTLLAPDPRRELLREASEGTLTLPPALRSADAVPGSFDTIRDRIRIRLLRTRD